MSTSHPSHRGARAVLYCRLSVATDLHDESTSMVRQQAALTALADREGWTVVETFLDDGESGGKVRAKQLAALDMIRRDEADVLAVWALDRWTRRGAADVGALVEVIDQRAAAGRPAWFVTATGAGGYSTDPADSDIVLSIIASVAKQERRAIQARARSSVRHLREVGRWPGGFLPPGYVSVDRTDGPGKTLEVDPRGAAYLERAARMILDGGSLRAVARWLNAEGYLTPRNKEWTTTVLYQVFTGTSIAGWTVIDGQVLRGDDGLPRQTFPPVIPLDLLAQVKACLEDRRANSKPRVGDRTPKAGARVLSGLVACTGCDGRMYYRHANSRGGSFVCQRFATGKLCESPATISANRLEAHVIGEYLAVVGKAEVWERTAHDAPAVELVTAERELKSITVALGSPDLSDEDDERLSAQRRALRRRVRDLRAAGPAVRETLAPTGETFADLWSRVGVDARRRMLGEVIESVEVTRAGKGGRFDMGRVRINWAREDNPEYDARFYDD